MANGRVCTGFSHPYVALYHANAGVISYSNGRSLARGVDVSIEPDTSDNKFYADNTVAEDASGIFTGGKAAVTVDGLKPDSHRLITGAPVAGTDGFAAFGDSQNPPYVGFGFITEYMEEGIRTYVPTVLVKTKFNVPKNSAKTRENQIDWQTQQLEASILRGDDAEHTWKYESDIAYSSEDLADQALRTKLNISSTSVYPVVQSLSHVTSDFTASSVAGGSALAVQLTPAEDYTISNVIVLMGGTDVSSTAYDSDTKKVTIASVTGDVSITAVGET